MPSAGLPANRIFAIGTPLARLFFEAQKTMAISSSRLKPRRRLSQVVPLSAIDSMIAVTPSKAARADIGTRCHKPSTTEALKAM